MTKLIFLETAVSKRTKSATGKALLASMRNTLTATGASGSEHPKQKRWKGVLVKKKHAKNPEREVVKFKNPAHMDLNCFPGAGNFAIRKVGVNFL